MWQTRGYNAFYSIIITFFLEGLRESMKTLRIINLCIEVAAFCIQNRNTIHSPATGDERKI
jgi:hypothetical protein